MRVRQCGSPDIMSWLNSGENLNSLFFCSLYSTYRAHVPHGHTHTLSLPPLPFSLFPPSLSLSHSLPITHSLTSSLLSRSSVSSTCTTASAPGGRGAPVVIRHTLPEDTLTLGCAEQDTTQLSGARVYDGVSPSLLQSLVPALLFLQAHQQLFTRL